MKAKFLLLLITLVLAVPAFSQKKHNKDKESLRREMTDFKINFLADELDLKDAQRKKFAEIYAQMETERWSIFSKIKQAENKLAAIKNPTEADYAQANKEKDEAREELARLDKKYDEKFASFLSQKQLYQLKEAEGKFKKTMKDCRDKRKETKKDKH